MSSEKKDSDGMKKRKEEMDRFLELYTQTKFIPPNLKIAPFRYPKKDGIRCLKCGYKVPKTNYCVMCGVALHSISQETSAVKEVK